MAVNNIVKRIQNIMRQDAGVNGDAQRIARHTFLSSLKNCAGAIGLWMKKTGKHLLVMISCLW